jgi:hypothetical protein
VFENRALMVIFGLKKGKVIRGWIEVLVERMREKRNAYKVLVGKPDGWILLGRPRHG